MRRSWGIVFALAFVAGAAHAEDERSAYMRAQARLTEQLNAVIAAGVELDAVAPPAKADEASDERAVAGSLRARS